MMPLSMETLFMILSGAILVAGVMYWLWSHIQLTQKKVQILENAVFELRGMLTSGAATGPPLSSSASPAPTPVSDSMPGSPTKVYADLADDAVEEEDWDADGEDVRVIKEVAPVSTPLETVIPELSVEEPLEREEEISDDLMPGGRIQMGEEAQFKELFAAPAPAAPRTPESLESMPVKELRRLAAQRGIQGADDMKKKEILAALRRQVSAPAAASTSSMTVEKTLDISEVIGAGAVAAEESEAGATTETVDAEILE